jgi:hypothetical protein
VKITFTMTPNENRPKHSTRFDFQRFEELTADAQVLEDGRFKPSFYVPKPLGEKSKRIRVTIEEVE